jgi:hypothetical protein
MENETNNIINEEEVIKDEEMSFDDKGDLIPNFHANRYQEDPRQDLCWNYFMESVLAGKPSIHDASIKAGYTPSSARRTSQTQWFRNKKKKLQRAGMLKNAEKNLDDVMRLKYKGKKINVKTGEEEDVIDIDTAKLVIDVSKTIVKSLGKDEGYSERSEVTGKDGNPIVIMPSELMDAFNLGEK